MGRKLIRARVEEAMSVPESRIKGPYLLRVLGLLLVLAVSLSCAGQRKPVAEREPPVSEEVSSELLMPPAVSETEIRGEAALPEEVRLGFAVDLDGKLLVEDWEARGHVRAFERGKVTFESDARQTGHFVYHLPAGLEISLNPGQPFSLKRTIQLCGRGLAYDLVASDSGHPLMEAGRLFGPDPLDKRTSTGLSIQQVRDRGPVALDSKYCKVYQISVTVTADGRTTTVPLRSPVRVRTRGGLYSLLVWRSNETVPTQDYVGVAEGTGYDLEYVVVPE
ncbi:MAG: hypothetical protein JSW03_07990 [Candidatus Eiseniibacteriota bacterium]|nr:MAG: hypothetical protein JSW03_07990 [Candidatus Eisenbacteria bacterium]